VGDGDAVVTNVVSSRKDSFKEKRQKKKKERRTRPAAKAPPRTFSERLFTSRTKADGPMRAGRTAGGGGGPPSSSPSSSSYLYSSGSSSSGGGGSGGGGGGGGGGSGGGSKYGKGIVLNLCASEVSLVGESGTGIPSLRFGRINLVPPYPRD
jgi:hypothetical protein